MPYYVRLKKEVTFMGGRFGISRRKEEAKENKKREGNKKRLEIGGVRTKPTQRAKSKGRRRFWNTIKREEEGVYLIRIRREDR